MKKSDILRRIAEIKRKLEGKIVIEGDSELRAGDILHGTIIDEGEHYSVGGTVRVIEPPATGEERERLLNELKELKKEYREAIEAEREEFIKKEAERIAGEIRATGKVTVHGFDSDFQLEPNKAIDYYEKIGNIRMVDAIRLAIELIDEMSEKEHVENEEEVREEEEDMEIDM